MPHVHGDPDVVERLTRRHTIKEHDVAGLYGNGASRQKEPLSRRPMLPSRNRR
jgi:hypothetical protein